MENLQPINAADLRIGNLVQVGNEIEKLELVDFADMYENSTLIHYHPIPLTEEWLLKLGFQKLYDNYYLLYVGSFKINYYYNFSGSTWKFMLEEELLDIKSVHELQNLYYSLTKKELTYERPTN
jgi:hypothetical protein